MPVHFTHGITQRKRKMRVSLQENTEADYNVCSVCVWPDEEVWLMSLIFNIQHEQCIYCCRDRGVDNIGIYLTITEGGLVIRQIALWVEDPGSVYQRDNVVHVSSHVFCQNVLQQDGVHWACSRWLKPQWNGIKRASCFCNVMFKNTPTSRLD